MPYKRTKKKKFVSGAVLTASVYASISFASGMVVGYLATRWFFKKYVENGPLKLIYIDFKGWKFHLHHWIFGALAIILLLISGEKSELPKFVWGFISGIIAHDLYDFDDWHKVVAKNV